MRPIVGFPIAYFITTVTKDRRPLLCDIWLVQRLATMIQMACAMKEFVLLAYAILPDHVHLLVVDQRILERMRWEDGGLDSSVPTNHTEGDLSRSPDVGDLMRSIKGTFSRVQQQGHVWQRRYYLRHVGADDLERVVRYIRFNSRKHNLPECFEHEPYCWIDESILERML